MIKRWLKKITQYTPSVDLRDLSYETYPFKSVKRQFAPEYTQFAYISMLKQEFATGDYISLPQTTLDINPFMRS